MSGPVSDTIKLSEAGAAETLPEGVPKVGDVIAGKYRVERVLGVGGMGVVLAVRHITLAELYAMKFLLPKGSTADAVGRFMREAKAAVRIKSEHIARVNDFGQLENGAPYIVMEHLEGLDLSEFVHRHGAQPASVAADFVIQACAGLAEAHQLGIVHRDLKPSNLFLTRRSDGTPLIKVLDFGISKAAADSAQPAITATHESFGSPAYMSPEQIRSAKNVDVRSDVFSLGVILFELLTARLPFEGETSAALLAAIAADPPARLSDLVPNANGDLEALLMRCLHKRKEDRFQSVSELATALSPFASAESMSLVQRIARLGAGSIMPPPASIPAPPVSSGHSRPNAKLAAAAATERPWTTQAGERGGRRSIVFAMIGGALAAVAVAVIVTAIRPSNPAGKLDMTNVGPSAPAVTSSPAPPSSVATPSSAAPTLSASAGAETANAAPSTNDSASTSPKPVPKVKVVVRPAPSAVPSAIVSVSPPAKPPASIDPTAESH